MWQGKVGGKGITDSEITDSVAMLAYFCIAASVSAYVVPPTCPRGITRVARCDAPLMRSAKEEARRQSALVTGINWPPRTPPTPGKGYFFFQGPTPKTAYQKDLPSFFSTENFADIEIKPVQIALAGTSFLSLALILAGLNAPMTDAPKPKVEAPKIELKAPSISLPKLEKKEAPPRPLRRRRRRRRGDAGAGSGAAAGSRPSAPRRRRRRRPRPRRPRRHHRRRRRRRPRRLPRRSPRPRPRPRRRRRRRPLRRRRRRRRRPRSTWTMARRLRPMSCARSSRARRRRSIREREMVMLFFSRRSPRAPKGQLAAPA